MVPLNQNDHQTGSPGQGEPVFLAIGKLRRPHGVKGEMIMDLLTDFPERLRSKRKIYVGQQHETLQIESIRPHQNRVLIKFVGFDTPEDVGKYRNLLVFVKSENLPELPEGEYYFHQLVDLQVEDQSGKLLGTLEEILETGANDVYLVRSPEGEEILIPAIDSVIIEVDLEHKVIRVNPPIWS